MKVTFQCEKCGRAYGEVGNLTMGTQTTREKIVDAMKAFEKAGCPNCSKLTYGPLTEEMVAEALWEAMRKDDDHVAPWTTRRANTVLDEDFRREARFVLRLLDRHQRAWGPYKATVEDKDWRDWLLDLARQQ